MKARARTVAAVDFEFRGHKDRDAQSDLRFSRLVGADWRELPAPIRRRFSRRLADGERIVYLGEVAQTRLRLFGRVLGQLTRLIGAPLPLEAGGRVPVTVVVTECESIGGQLWTRIYGRRNSFAQVIQSAKLFHGPTGCEEIVGGGIGMRLGVTVEHRALVFRSCGYFLRFGSWTMSLPALLTPGQIEVVHREERAGQFSFKLTLTHPLAGRIVEQLAFFRDSSGA